MLNGYRIVSEMEKVLKSGYYKSLLGYNNVEWFVDEVIKLENKMAFYFKRTNNDVNMTEKNEEVCRSNNICRFRGKIIESDKVRDHCHLTGKFRGPAHGKCNINVTQKQNNFIAIVFHFLSNYDCHMFIKKLVDKENDMVEFDIIPETNEEYINVTFGCIRFIDSYRYLSNSLDPLVETIVDKSKKTLKNLKRNFDHVEISGIFTEIGEEDRAIEDLKRE